MTSNRVYTLMRHHKLFMVPFILLLAIFFVIPSPASANDPLVTNNQALELLRQGEYEKALDLLQGDYARFPYNETLRRNLAEAYVYVAQREMKINRYAEAAEYFGRVRDLRPDNAGYGLMRGVALYLTKNYEGAKREFEWAQGVGGDTVELFFYQGKVAYDTGDLAGALKFWEKALTFDGGNNVVREHVEKVRRELAVEGRMDKGQSSRFEMSYDAEVAPNLAAAILDVLESAYNMVGADLDHFPTARVPVILYTKKDYRNLIAGPDWSGGMYDGKIRFPIGGMTEINPQLRSVLVHEYTHVVVHELTRGNVPTWLNEGLAVYEQRREFTPPPPTPLAIKPGDFLSLATLEGPFNFLGATEAVRAYLQSYSLVNFIISTYGWYNVKAILLNLGEKMPLNAAVKKALTGFDLDYPTVVREWQSFNTRETGGKP